jgi:hypothetical protein
MWQRAVFELLTLLRLWKGGVRSEAEFTTVRRVSRWLFTHLQLLKERVGTTTETNKLHIVLHCESALWSMGFASGTSTGAYCNGDCVAT